MEPPAKRLRTGPSSSTPQSNDDEGDELIYEPDEVSRMRDPGYQLDQSRAFAAFKLKSTFEHIFQKYERDFTGIGDEIDLRTGKIITNNGHLERMRNERDTGVQDEEQEEDEGVLLEDAFVSGDEESEEDNGDGNENPDASDNEEDEELILHSKDTVTPDSVTSVSRRRIEDQRRPDLSQSLPSVSRLEPRQRQSSLSSFRHSGVFDVSSSANLWGSDPDAVDPTWRAPDIQQTRLGDSLISKLYGARYRFPATQGSQSVWSSRRDSELDKAEAEPVRIDLALLARSRNEASKSARSTLTKLLPAFTTEEENEDDVLGLSNTDRVPRTEKKLPTQNGTLSQEKLGVDMTNSSKQESLVPAHNEPQRAAQRRNQTMTASETLPKGQLATTKAGKKSPLLIGPIGKTNQDRHNVEGTRDDHSESSPVFVTDAEMRERPKQKLVIELFSKVPAPEELTEFEDPENTDQGSATLRQKTMPPPVDVAVPLGPEGSTTLEVHESLAPEPNEQQTDATAVVTKRTNNASVSLKEKFSRHEIDPSYAFSDDEDGIPVVRTRTRPDKEPAPDAAKPIKSIPGTESQQGDGLNCLDLNDARAEEDSMGVQFDFSIQDLAKERPNMDADISMEDHASEPTDEAEKHNILQPQPASEEVFRSDSATSPEQAFKNGQTEEESTSQTSRATVAVDTTGDPERDPDAHRAEQEREEEVGGFVVPIGLDKIDDASATEPETTDVELPTLPASAERHTLRGRPRRGRPSSSATKRSDRVPQNVTSPMRRLNLQSSSPLKKHRKSGGANARTSIRIGDPPSPPKSTSKPPGRRHNRTGSTDQTYSNTINASDPDTIPADSLAPARRQKHHPSTPSRRPPKSHNSSSRVSSGRPFVSLLADDDDDELTLDLFKTWTEREEPSSSSQRKMVSYMPVLLRGPQTKLRTPTTQRTPTVVGSGTAGSSTARGKKRKATWAFATPTKTDLDLPSASPVRTPGGHLRRCGEDGFRCDRDFCFVCL
ncbi:Uncharacterized protein PB1A10.02 [Colletotrichum chlorophyti]|uniref:Uncharacterized protein PB1A10.02 n=1 Tax=Colletotrichum chlorophyti TaxID=708187 RepID=A0A1Q8RBM6_9PEZI|nr:Uncharacterized protein PB1A10.02 [Colletotrichum chlorophyti]